MKFLILMAAIVALGMILVFTAILYQPPAEIQADLTEIKQEIPSVPEETESVEVIAKVEEPVEEVPEKKRSATESACLALVERYQEDLEDAENEMNDLLEEYEQADEIFDDYLGVDDRDEARVDELRENKKLAEDEYDEAKDEYNGAVKRYNRARDECGLR